MNDQRIYGYAAESKQVRQYQTNDTDSVYRALSANIQEYLSHEGLVERSPFRLSHTLLQIFTAALGVWIFVVKVSFKAQPFLTVGCFVSFAALVAGQLISAFMQHSSNVVFESTGSLRADAQPRKCFRALQGRRIRIVLALDGFSTNARITAQCVGPSHTFSPANIFKSEQMAVQYGKYFGSTGYFYPPALVHDLDAMLSALARGEH